MMSCGREVRCNGGLLDVSGAQRVETGERETETAARREPPSDKGSGS
jgi:hypothetical protein